MSDLELQLGEAELEVLNVLWDHGPATVREVMNRLHEQGRTVAYTTVLTFLTRLEQKGFAASDRSDLAYVYKAAVKREHVRTSRLRSLVDQLYDGAACPLVMHLLDSGEFTRDEIAQLQALIDRLDAQTKPDKRRSRKSS